jgi:hypothetical protein
MTVASSVADTTPYPWPYDGVIDPTVSALVLTGGGRSWAQRVPDDVGAAQAISALRGGLVPLGVLVVVVDTEVPAGRPTAVADSAVALVAGAGELSIVAAGIDGFYGSALDAILRRNGRTHLLVAGLGLETTVHSTVRRANDRGYECLTVIDACLPHDTALVHASRSSIEMSGGIFGAVGASAAVLAAYRSTSDTPISS